MKKILLTTALVLVATPAFTKEYIIKASTDYDAKKQHFYSPDRLTIQPGDTVIFENAQDEMHDVMFASVPKALNEIIMSQTMEKQGEKFSYTFNVPGTYKYHCHPHEELGMTGILIVGKASTASELKKIGHQEMAEKVKGVEPSLDSTKATSLAQGTGKVISVDTGKRSIKMKHDPMKALGWPTMVMTFTVDEGVDLSAYKEGDAVSFTLKPVGKEDYSIVNIKKVQ